MRRNSAKLSRRHRAWLYTVTLVVYLTGAAWGWLHYAGSRSDELALPSPLEPWLMRLHGAGAMALLVILGTLLPGHVRFAWHVHRNRPNGIMLVSVLAFLIFTGYGLYYFGDERLRSWTSSLHLVVGLILPVALILHIRSGRRSDVALSRRQPQTTDLVGKSHQL